MNPTKSQSDVKVVNTDSLVQELLQNAEVQQDLLTAEKRKVLIAELRKRDRALLATESAHGPG